MNAPAFPAEAVAARAGDADRRKLGTWILCWILLPNAGFWMLWLVGAPPRFPEIFATGVVGLLVRNAAYPVKMGGFLAASLYSVTCFIAHLFNLASSEIIVSIQYMADMQPAASIEYLGAVALAVATIGAAAWLLRKPTDFRSIRLLLVAMAALLAAVGLDMWMSYGIRGSYSRSAPDGAPFASAVERSGFLKGADGERHLIIVMVESMGAPATPAVRARIGERWRQPDIAARYAVTEGLSPFFGSTTRGEMRELCGRWDDYRDLLDRADPTCLPATLKRAGYATSAIHSFTADFFDRELWYRNLGFERLTFRAELLAEGARGCPGVFPGVCDRDVPEILGRRLAGAETPQFVYWLTVNSHIPIPESRRQGTDDCAAYDADLAERLQQVCRLLQIFADTDARLAEVLLADDFPPADILIVGDHMPPYFDRASRVQFDPAHVPWVLLRRKEP